jgi:putative oxidoreductase
MPRTAAISVRHCLCAFNSIEAAAPGITSNQLQGEPMNFIVYLLIRLPAQIASYFSWAGPLLMRLIVGYVFMLTGWGKLNNLPQMIQNFTEWGIPFPKILTPFVSGVECFGGIMLMLGLFTRIPAAMLAVVMVVAVKAAKWDDVDSLETLLGFEEATYFAAFMWLAIAGPGAASLDRLLLNFTGHRKEST